MSKHTPGPWFNAGRDDGDGRINIKSAARGINCDFYIAIVGGLPEKEEAANASLVAAAPEMLEALRRSLSWLSSYPGEGAMGCYDQARAAIAKATGEPS